MSRLDDGVRVLPDDAFELLMFHSNVPWPPGFFDLRRLTELGVGDIIAPARWETAYVAGEAGLPWATVERQPFNLKALRPGQTEWHYETRVPCRLPSGEVLYYIGAPAEFVRVIVPPPVTW